MRSVVRRSILLLALLCLAPTVYGATITLSFLGQVDGSGTLLGGVSASTRSPFTLDIGIDDAHALTGVYPVRSISYTLTLGTYTTTTAWAVNLVATGSGTTMNLRSDPRFSFPDEHFLLDLSDFAAGARHDDPLTWDTATPMLTGDILVRGLGGISSLDQLSGKYPLMGTLDLDVYMVTSPEPGTLFLLGTGLLGLARYSRKNH